MPFTGAGSQAKAAKLPENAAYRYYSTTHRFAMVWPKEPL